MTKNVKALEKAIRSVKGMTKQDARLMVALLMFTSLRMKIRCMDALNYIEGLPRMKRDRSLDLPKATKGGRDG